MPVTALPTITASPSTPNPFDSCDDSRYGTFFVSETGKEHTCVWLRSRPEFKTIYCNPTHPEKAFDICEESCSKCTDECDDDNGIPIMIGTTMRNCDYIAIRDNLIDEQCKAGMVAFSACRETCNSCLPPASDVKPWSRQWITPPNTWP